MFCKHCKLVFSKREPHQHKCLAHFGKLVTRNQRVKYKYCTAKHTGACIREAFEREVISQKKTTIEIHRCSVCSLTLSEKWNLSRHQQIHFKRKRFRSENCFTTFSQKSNLKRHRKTHMPSSKKTFNCKVCSKTFASKFNFLRHKQNSHRREQTGIFFGDTGGGEGANPSIGLNNLKNS